MKIKRYTCTLLSDIVLNASLATEGNMTSLDYIPGSNFLGIVARDYDAFGAKAMDVFHNGKVKFGNAYISDGVQPYYPMPLDIMKPKEEGNEAYYLNHKVDHKDPEIMSLQLKQVRSGYISGDVQPFKFIKKVDKIFALKSAYDATKRRTAESQMYGFDALRQGQVFFFDVWYEDETLVDEVESRLLGQKRVGKSKTAEYGQVCIEEVVEVTNNEMEASGDVIVYAVSNLCFYDENGQPTLTPTAEHLGVPDGKIDYSKSSVRSYSYSPWNARRHTSGIERHCIVRGSVFYVKNDAPTKLGSAYVGAYQAEGLGAVWYNPPFLLSRNDRIEIDKITHNAKVTYIKINNNTQPLLLNKLNALKNEKDSSLTIANKINKDLKDNFGIYKDISRSQWGRVRSFAEDVIFRKVENKNLELRDTLQGELSKGNAALNQWDKNGGQARSNLIKLAETHGPVFIAKLASEIAKKINRKESHYAK